MKGARLPRHCLIAQPSFSYPQPLKDTTDPLVTSPWEAAVFSFYLQNVLEVDFFPALFSSRVVRLPHTRALFYNDILLREKGKAKGQKRALVARTAHTLNKKADP